jgi:hypothetical protein
MQCVSEYFAGTILLFSALGSLLCISIVVSQAHTQFIVFFMSVDLNSMEYSGNERIPLLGSMKSNQRDSAARDWLSSSMPKNPLHTRSTSVSSHDRSHAIYGLNRDAENGFYDNQSDSEIIARPTSHTQLDNDFEEYLIANRILKTGRQRKKIAARSKGGEFQKEKRKKRRVYFACISKEIDIQVCSQYNISFLILMLIHGVLKLNEHTILYEEVHLFLKLQYIITNSCHVMYIAII